MGLPQSPGDVKRHQAGWADRAVVIRTLPAQEQIWIYRTALAEGSTAF